MAAPAPPAAPQPVTPVVLAPQQTAPSQTAPAVAAAPAAPRTRPRKPPSPPVEPKPIVLMQTEPVPQWHPEQIDVLMAAEALENRERCELDTFACCVTSLFVVLRACLNTGKYV